MRRCMSFGFTDKKSKSAIGQCTDYSYIYFKFVLLSYSI